MVKISRFSFDNPRYQNLLSRRSSIPETVEITVKDVLKNVKEKGDEALHSYMKKFDGVDINEIGLMVTEEEFEAPNGCEQVLSLLYALLESNPGLPMGRIYCEHQCEILRETVYRLFMVIDGFSSVKLTVTNSSGVTETTLTHTKSVTKQ